MALTSDQPLTFWIQRIHVRLSVFTRIRSVWGHTSITLTTPLQIAYISAWFESAISRADMPDSLSLPISDLMKKAQAHLSRTGEASVYRVTNIVLVNWRLRQESNLHLDRVTVLITPFNSTLKGASAAVKSRVSQRQPLG